MSSVLNNFHPAVQGWFTKTFGQPSPPQQLGWHSILSGKNTLIVAPTGSGKTLAAFLWCINHLVEENISLSNAVASDEKTGTKQSSQTSEQSPRRSAKGVASPNCNLFWGIRVLYISPLKALNNDIHRNLEIPLQGILQEAKAQGVHLTPISSAVRTGDTTQAERNRMLKNPPDILITTPESFYIMLSSEKSRKLFHSVRYVIVDEIHAVSSNKRGVHLSLTLERLERLVQQSHNDEERTFVRIGLSATQKPLDEIAKFLSGMKWENKKLVPRVVNIVDAGYKKNVDLRVICAPRDFAAMPMDSAWNSIYPKLLEEIFQHNTTLIFVNNRRLAERLSAKLNEILEGDTNTLALYSVPVFAKKNVKQSAFAPLKVFAYHGSMSRAVREQLESDLKLGKIRALVTTSALELGIDIGSVDLVIQIQSPKGIARGLQRVGRSGHLVSAQSKGRIFVTHREDLLESAVVAKGMKEHAIEQTCIPQNCLDVLAQQIIAMVGVEDWNVEELFDVIRQSYCYRALTEKIFYSVLNMVAGRYTNEAFRELRARIIWNKLHNNLTALPGSLTLVLTNAGTIPDRGYYSVYLEDLKTKVGEVDEEFIYESRIGDTFILGSSIWKMVAIDANKVIVQPAPGRPARMPFWRGEMIGRTYELSLKVGECIEQLSFPSHNAKEGGNNFPFFIGKEEEEERFLDEHSLCNIIEYIKEQKEATQLVPSHTTIVVEGFRDEIGDPRIVVHSRFGKGVNGLLGLVLLQYLQQRLNIEIQMLYNDDGILFRCSDVERLPLDILSSIDFGAAERIILEQLPSSPLFGALFRQNAERALLLPKGSSRKRRPFFLQRLKAADLLQIVKQYGDFPIVIETMRECLNDVLDFQHFKEVLSKIEAGAIRIHTVHTEVPSPFAASLLFDFTMVYMYQWDEPKSINKESAEWRLQLNRELLSEVVQIDAATSVVRAEAIATVEEQLQFTSATRKARSASELMEVFLRLGELTEEEMRARTEREEFIQELLSKNIIVPILIGNSERFILSEEIPLYLPIAKIKEEWMTAELLNKPNIQPGSQSYWGMTVQRAFTKDESLQYLILRTLRSHGPLLVKEIAARYAMEEHECEKILHAVKKSENIIHGILTQQTTEEQWCYLPNLERIHRASINILRKEITPATLADFTQLLLQWQNRHPTTQEEGEEGVRTVIEKLQGYVLPSELWEAEIFRNRIRYYDGAAIRSLALRGEIVCVGANAGKSFWVERGEGNYFLAEKETLMEKLSPSSQKVYNMLKQNGASFLSDIREEINISLSALNHSLSDLFWRGLITNDVVDEILNVKRYRSADETHRYLPEERIEIVNPKRNPFRKTAMSSARKALKNVPGWNGRWSLVHTRNILGAKISDEEKIRRQAQQLLLRYGIVARELAKREENLLPWSLLAMEFQRMEMRGEIRRGYFFEGLSGMQFALPEAVSLLEAIKAERGVKEEPIVLNSCDPANPYGVGVELFQHSPAFRTKEAAQVTMQSAFKISRLASNFIVFNKGVPILLLENFGARMFFIAEPSFDAVKSGLLQFIHHLRASYSNRNEIVVEYCDNHRPSESGAAELLRSIGFYRDKVQTMRLDLR